MKKIIIIFIVILIAVYLALSVLGAKDEYPAERLFYRALKTNEKILINPDVAPPKMLTAVEKDLKTVLTKFPDSRTAKAAHLSLAEFYIINKRYNDALSTLDDIIVAEGQDIAMLSKAHFFKGSIYEKQGRWDKALEEYAILRDEYTDTSLGVQVPLYIGRYYMGKGEEAEAKAAYMEAIGFYENLERNNKGSLLGYTAATLLREAHISIGDYEQAGRVIEDTINNYSSDLVFAQQMPYVEVIFVNALKRPEKAVEIYKKVRQKAKDEKLIEILDKKIEQLETQ
jgi:tetratricopeptide (TPR) repeat protein